MPRPLCCPRLRSKAIVEHELPEQLFLDAAPLQRLIGSFLSREEGVPLGFHVVVR